jgi:hypothetical protein
LRGGVASGVDEDGSAGRASAGDIGAEAALALVTPAGAFNTLKFSLRGKPGDFSKSE